MWDNSIPEVLSIDLVVDIPQEAVAGAWLKTALDKIDIILVIGGRNGCELAHNFHFLIKREMCNGKQNLLLLRRRDVNWRTISMSLSKEKCSISHITHFFRKERCGTQFPFLCQSRDVQWPTILSPSWKEGCELAQNFHFFIKGEMFNCTQFSLLLERRDVNWDPISICL